MVGSSPTRNALTTRPSFWRAARVRDWAHFLLLPLAGMQVGATVADNAFALGRGAVVAFCVLAFGYLLNGLADRDMDEPDKSPLAGAPVDGSYVVVLAVLAAVALLASLLGPWVATAATALALLSGVLYSVGPRLKRYPVLGTLSNGTNFAPLLWVGLPASGAALGMGPLTLAFLLLLIQNQLLHEGADRYEDIRGDLKTTFTVLGHRGSAAAAALLGLGLGAMLWQHGLLAPAIGTGVVFGVAVPLFVLVRGDDPAAMTRARLGHRLISLGAGAWLFALLRWP